MKNISKILTLGVVAMTLAGCADDLNTHYQGSYVTTQDKEEVLKLDPKKAQAAVTGAFANFIKLGSGYGSDHYMFGYPSIMLGLDLQTEDFACKQSGYNWHSAWESYSSPNMNGTPTNMMWNNIYPQIFTTNALIATIPADTEEAELQFYLANGLALRAFDYFNLVQLYAFNYATHKQDKCVPVITNENSEEAAANGAPRATVEEVYNLILSDLNLAAELMDKSGIDPSQVISSKPKRLFSQASVYGLRARVKLVMQDWAGAAADAEKAIQSFPGSPYQASELMTPGFTSLDEHSWMWGIALAETDDCVNTGIINQPSFLCSFAYGYATYGAWKYCGYGLYEAIPDTDVRKGWFLDDDYKSDHLSAQWQAFIDQYIGYPNYAAQDNTVSVYPQANVKFGPYKGVLEQDINASDIPLMRVEEMYLIQAEAKAMGGDVAAGKQMLETFVRNYRDSKYTCAASSPEEVQQACHLQRRIEFWGEGLAYFDVLRLNLGIDRVGCRFPDQYTYKIEPGDMTLLYSVPESEITANKQITAAEVKDYQCSRPVPVGVGGEDE